MRSFVCFFVRSFVRSLIGLFFHSSAPLFVPSLLCVMVLGTCQDRRQSWGHRRRRRLRPSLADSVSCHSTDSSLPVSQPHIFNVTAHILLKTKSCWVASTCLSAHILNFTAHPLLKTKSCWVAAPPQCLHSHALCTHIHSSSTFENQILLGGAAHPRHPACIHMSPYTQT